MALAKISPASALSLTLVKDHATPADLKEARTSIFSEAKAQYGIPQSVKIRVEIRDRTNPLYCVIRDKRDNTFELGDDGRWVGAAPVVQAAPVVKPQWYAIDAKALVDYIQDFVDDGDEGVTVVDDLPQVTTMVGTSDNPVYAGNGKFFIAKD